MPLGHYNRRMFSEWLGQAIRESGLSKRQLARRMAAKHVRGATPDTIETARRTLNKILAGDLNPTQPTRDAIAAALGRDDQPSDDPDEEEADLAAQLAHIARELSTLQRKVGKRSAAA